jgi:LacI family transcriptional regulator
MDRLLSETAFDGVVVSNGPMCIGALQVLDERGYSVPDDVGVVGFDEEPWAWAYRPPLTVVAQPTYDIGRRAAELLLDRIADHALEPRRLLLPAHLVVGQSSLRRVRVSGRPGE